ncbi:TetR/AcrR family transcriptional regulator [Streptomyces uncialis]|uniref:TetR/AcrR family transcriptional regulator n=1 Tax=Streptomyces uncialis TaxID=1048205 RepID=UPI0038664E1A|nr:TetR/AcrR family transcriptional regulator [Streptomyces uncialis]
MAARVTGEAYVADMESGTGLPASLEVAWGLRERPAKGPRPGLSLDRIVDTAVRIAAAEGLGAVSMGRVAKELGASTMSLYRYVGARDELYVLMQEAAVGAPPEAPPAGTEWRACLAWWARAQRAVFRRNLWLLRIPTSGPPVGPNSLAWMEAALAGLDGTGLREEEKLSVLMLVGGYVRNASVLVSDLEAGMRASGVGTDESLRRYAAALRALTDAGRHPALTRLLGSGVFEHGDHGDGADVDFDFGLDRVLDGIEALVVSRR